MERFKGFFYGVSASFCYALMSIFAKLAKEVSVIELIFFRSLLSVFFIFIFFNKNFRWKVLKKKLLFFRIFFGFLYLICFYWAIKKLDFVSDAITLANTANLFIPLIFLFYDKKKISFINIFSLFLGFLGVLMILKPEFHVFNVFGILGLLAGFSLALTSVMLRKLSKTESVQTIILYFFLSNVIVSFVPFVSSFQSFTTSIMWVYIILVSILGFLYQIFKTKAYALVCPSRVSVVFYSIIIFTVFLEWLFCKKIPSLYSWIGFLMILSGGVMGYLGKDLKLFFRRSKKRNLT